MTALEAPLRPLNAPQARVAAAGVPWTHLAASGAPGAPLAVLEPEWQLNPYDGLVLQLGAGRRPLRGAVNHDRVQHAPYIDVAWDLDVMPWTELCPGFDVVVALDVFEHLRDPYGAVNECHRLLVPGGVLLMRVSAWDNPATYNDLTHKHRCESNAFDFFDRSTALGGHYAAYHPADSLGRLPTRWAVDGADRVNADQRWPDRGDWFFVLVRE